MSARHPHWLTKKAPSELILKEMKALLDGLSLRTVCQSALCPNLGDCFSQHVATFLLMGDICTRNCGFCAIREGKPSSLNLNEPWNVARAVERLQLKHVVLTSVTRDDLADGGAAHFAQTINAVRQTSPQTTVEVLVPDFGGSPDALKTVVESHPEVIAHNVETVPRLYAVMRPEANYYRSLNLLLMVKSMGRGILTKSGLMLGVGEEHHEIMTVMQNLHDVGTDFLTIGQYLAPSSKHYPAISYITPEDFEEYKSLGIRIGFSSVTAAPFVRSSFNAGEVLQAYYINSNKRRDADKAIIPQA